MDTKELNDEELKKELDRFVKLGLLDKSKKGYIDSDYSRKIDAMTNRNAFLNGLKKGRQEIIKQFEIWFDIKDREDNDYFECSIGEIRKFLKKLEEK